MPPTIGRIVLYRPQKADLEPRPAIVTKVWNETCVNLQVFGESLEEGLNPTSVVQGEGAREWAWPPRV